ncbi:MAG: hypothetical protein IKA36_02325 [Clostridia bacterium]|nr:hypothetical protein [Clostridia bacterium]
MSGYILSILGIVIAEVVIDVIIPSGNISKYIKSIFSIFVIVVLLAPIINFINNFKGVNLDTNNLKPDEKLLNFIYKSQVISKEQTIEKELGNNGLNDIDIKLNFSTENNELKINSCIVILKNMTNNSDNQHIDIYQNIYEVVNKYTGLNNKEIIYE